MARRSPGERRHSPLLFCALVALLLVVAPALDLAWHEPALDGAPCQLQANPGVALPPVSPVVTCAAEWLLPVDGPGRVPLMGASIFVPPRV